MTGSASLRIRVVVAGVAFAATACAAGDTVQVIGTDPVIVVHDFSSGMQMQVEATLAYDPRSKCLRLDFRSGPSMLPVWPRSTRPLIHGGKRGVQAPTAGRIVEGDTIIAGGGSADWASNRPGGVKLPPDCLPAERDFSVFVINADDPITVDSR